MSSRVALILACMKQEAPAGALALKRTEENLYLLANIPSQESGSKAEISQWLSYSQTLVVQELEALDRFLESRSFLVGISFSVADAAVFVALQSHVAFLSTSTFGHVRRYFLLAQHYCLCANFPKVDFPAEPLLIPIGCGRQQKAPSSSSPVPSSSSSSSSSSSVPSEGVAGGAGNAGGAKKEKVPKAEKPAAASAAADGEEGGAGGGAELDPSKLDIRVGCVVKCWNHPESEKLLCEEVDLGEPSGPRSIASGIRAHYSADDFVGKKVLVLANLKERAIAGFKSNGMVLCACNVDHTEVKLLEPPIGAVIGARVSFAGFNSEAATPAQMVKKKILEKISPDLKTNESGLAFWQNAALSLPEGAVFSRQANAQIS